MNVNSKVKLWCSATQGFRVIKAVDSLQRGTRDQTGTHEVLDGMR